MSKAIAKSADKFEPVIQRSDKNLMHALNTSVMSTDWKTFHTETMRALSLMTQVNWTKKGQTMAARSAILECANAGYIPNRHAYLVPFYDSKAGIHNIVCITSFRGTIERLAAAGFTVYDPQIVHEADEFELTREIGDGGYRTRMRHTEARGERGYPIGVYAACKHGDGVEVVYLHKSYMDKLQSYAVKRSGGRPTPWTPGGEMGDENLMAMWRKTAVLRLAKWRAFGLPKLSGDIAEEEEGKEEPEIVAELGNAEQPKEMGADDIPPANQEDI